MSHILASLAHRFGGRAACASGAAAAALAAFAGYPHRVNASSSSAEASALPLDPNEWRPLRLVSAQPLTGGDRPTALLRFALPPAHPPLPVASCLLVRAPVGAAKEDGTRAFVMRPYTPVSEPDAEHLDLALKYYAGGTLTSFLSTLKEGDTLEFKGPIPKLAVGEVEKRSAVGMVAGGTGVTPMLQLAKELLRRGYTAPVSLVYANVSPSDIMLKDDLDALAAKHPNFSVFYVVDKVAAGQKWGGGVGYVTPEMLRAHLPPPGKDALVCVCGPPGMMKVVSGAKVSPKDQGPLTGMLSALAYTAAEVFKF